MFVYMSKKIAIPKQSTVSCLAWNRTAGYIAVGGDDGMLKVLKLESGGSGNLSMNLSLEGHSGQLQVAVWNDLHQKLTTSDEQGVIIVWMLYKGSWYEEMINNRNKSTVSSMTWSCDGQRICIAYEDGAVIVGSVDGSRVWGKDIKCPGLTSVQWSPDNTMLLFAFTTGELHLYDNNGNHITDVPVQCCPTPSKVVSMEWYSGNVTNDRPALVVCYSNGRFQLMRNYNDEAMIVVDSGLDAVDCKWNYSGTNIAVAGCTKENVNVVQFFSPYGVHLRSLRVPNGSMKAISWEGRSLRLAIAVDSFIYFANVKPDHKWSYFDNTYVFASSQDTVTFWDFTTHESWTCHIPDVVTIAACDEYCGVGTRDQLIIANQLGIQCDVKQMSFELCYLAMNSKGVAVIASKHKFMIWKFVNISKQGSGEQVFNSDGTPSIGDTELTDPISCIACSDIHLLVGRESGSVMLFSLLNYKRINSYNLISKPDKMSFNYNSSKFYVIDVNGCIYLFECDVVSNLGTPQPLKKDVWSALWAQDNPNLLALTEKARLYIYRNGEPEEPLTANGYLCYFKELELMSVLLDEISSDKLSEDYLIKVEVKSLRDTRQLIEKVGLKEAEKFIKDNPHPRLWLLLAEAALKRLKEEGALETAESAFIRRNDYLGVSLIKRIKLLHKDTLKHAEVAIYFGDYDTAENIFLEEDRRDLAISMRQRLCHWFRVLELLKQSPNSNEGQMKQVYDNIALHYADRQEWSKAIEYYKMSNNIEGLKHCYYIMDDVMSLKKLNITSPPHKKTAGVVKLDSDVGYLPPNITTVLRLKDDGKLTQAANIAFKLAQQEASVKGSPQKIKKLYILAGHLYGSQGIESTKNTDALRCYKMAAAQHWLQLATNHAHARPMRTDIAMRMAARLQHHIPQLHENQTVQAWCTIALISAEARAYGTCSNAFIQLEAITKESKFESLAIDLFTRHNPKDPKTNRVDCPKCKVALSEWATSCSQCGEEFPGCSLSGRPLYDKHTIWTCSVCQQTTLQHELVLRHSCPMCHSPVL